MSQITEVIHTNNQATKAEIFEHLTPKQRSSIIFYHKDGLTWQDLDPRQNRYNSVYVQFVRCSGHFIKEENIIWNCHQEGCEFFCTQSRIHFFSFGDEEKYGPSKPTSSPIKADDISIIGRAGSTNHLLNAHPDWTRKKLGKLGVKTSEPIFNYLYR